MRWDCGYANALVITMATVVITALTVAPMVPTLIIPVPVPAVTPAIMMALPIAWNVFAVVPVVSHKVDPLTASVVFAAMPAPMFGMARRYAQIDRRAGHRYPLDDYRLTINHSRLGIAADIQSTIETGFADAYRDPNISSEYRSSNCGGD